MMNNTVQHTDKPVKQVIAQIKREAKEFWVFCVKHPVVGTLLILFTLSFSIGGLVIYIHHLEKVGTLARFLSWLERTTILEKIADIGSFIVFAAMMWAMVTSPPRSYIPRLRLLPVKVENAIIQAPVKAFDYICSLFIKGKK